MSSRGCTRGMSLDGKRWQICTVRCINTLRDWRYTRIVLDVPSASGGEDVGRERLAFIGFPADLLWLILGLDGKAIEEKVTMLVKDGQ